VASRRTIEKVPRFLWHFHAGCLRRRRRRLSGKVRTFLWRRLAVLAVITPTRPHLASVIRHPASVICHLAFFDSALNVTPLTMLNRANLLAEKAMVLSKAGRREEAVACAEQTEEFLKPIETNGDNESVTKFIGWLGHGGGLLSRFVDPLGSVEWQSLAAVALNLDGDRRV